MWETFEAVLAYFAFFETPISLFSEIQFLSDAVFSDLDEILA